MDCPLRFSSLLLFDVIMVAPPQKNGRLLYIERERERHMCVHAFSCDKILGLPPPSPRLPQHIRDGMGWNGME